MTETAPSADDSTEAPHASGTEITLDQQVALKSAATRLAGNFEGVFGPETIERFLTSSYEQFANQATVANFLPLLAERFAKQRLTALAKVEGKVGDGVSRSDEYFGGGPIAFYQLIRDWRADGMAGLSFD